MSRPRLLVIDDDPVMRELLDALLAMDGFEVEVCASGDEGLARFAAEGAAFDAVLTDMHMPGLQGEALAAQLVAARRPGVALLGMSGSEPTEGETRLFDAFLVKPFTVEAFREALAAAQRSVHTSTAPEELSAAVLDEAVFERLAAALPADALRGLFQLTLDDVRERLERMEAAAAAGDSETVHREAHAIKGSCGMVGAAELHTLAAATEAGTALDTSRMALFESACERLERMLNEKLPADT